MTNCQECPVKTPACEGLRRKVYCGWAASGDPVLVKHVVDKSGPTLAAAASNALAAAGRVFAAAVKGEPVKATPEKAGARLALCEACPRFDPVARRCRARSCGCFVDLKTKLETESCPEGRW